VLILPVHEKATEQDSGASALLVAISLLVLMGFTGLAIDGGILFNDRRQQQAAADGGSLAAVQFAKTGTPTVQCTALTGTTRAACRGAEEAIDVVEGTLPGRYALVGDWDTCVDTNKPAEYTIASSLSDCISFTTNFQSARVALPGTDVDTSFARVIGISTVHVAAFAEATLDIDQSASVLPFALGPSGAGSNLACLMANSTANLDIYPCNGPAQGNFGKLDVALYGNKTLKTPEICGNSQTSTKVGVNLVVGSDHLINKSSFAPGNVDDFTNCAIIANPVDRLHVQTGNSAGGLEDGLFTGVSTPALEGRLMCKDGDASENLSAGVDSLVCVEVLNSFPEFVDDTPLWHYINAADADETVPLDACNPLDPIDTHQEMEFCLQGWRNRGHLSTTSLFTFDLMTATRFAAVPILASDPSNGTGTYDVIEFRPVYLSTFYLKCNANTCDVAHSPGEPSSGPCPNPIDSTANSCGFPANGNKSIVALTSYILTLDMLHPDIREDFPAREGTVVFNLSK